MTAAPPERSWRLLVDGCRDGSWNMAVDEALLDIRSDGRGDARPVLRLYGWTPAALSLGRGQRADVDVGYLEAQRIEIVRRPTGGRAVLHDRERTYAVAAGLRSEAFPGGVVDTYRRIAAALVAGLRVLGLDTATLDDTKEAGAGAPTAADPVCFQSASTHEIAVGGKKLLGSAQLRRRGAFLQHGSLPIVFDAERTARALGAARPLGGTDLVSALGREPGVDEIDRALRTGFAAELGVRLVPGGLTDEEHIRAAQLYSWKYSSLEWTLHGRYGNRERRWGPL